MKKQLLALAALAAVSSVAVAQSATVYGFLDAGVFTTSNGQGGKTQTTMNNAGGVWFPSMYGITGSEDLGGGLKASFNLQGSLGNMTGANSDGGNIFGRYSSLTLSGSAGSVELGRQIDLLFMQSFINGVMPTHANSLAVNGVLKYGCGDHATTACSAGSSAGNTDGTRINNAVTYRTPSLNGTQLAVMYAPGGTAGSSSANSITSGVLTSSLSGVALSAGYLQENSSTASNVYNKYLLGAKYSVGQIDLAGQWHNYKAKDASVKTSAYELGVAYHVSPKATVGLNYESFDSKADSKKPKITSLKAKYDLSKRTYLYGMAASYNADAATSIYQGYVSADPSGFTNTSANKSASNFAVGIVHGF